MEGNWEVPFASEAERAKKALEAFLGVCEAIDEVIAAHGPQGMPSGHLYAMVCGKMSLGMYQKVLDTLTDAGMIKHQGYLLISTKGGTRNGPDDRNRHEQPHSDPNLLPGTTQR